MRVITWNVNGLADPKKERQVLRRLLSFKADVIILQEIYKHKSNQHPTYIAKKVEDIENLAKYYWKNDMFFHPQGRIAILSNFNNALKITNTFADGCIIDFTFTHLARGDRKLQIPYFTINMRALSVIGHWIEMQLIVMLHKYFI